MRLINPIKVAPSTDSTYRVPTEFERAILHGLQRKPRGAVYQGYSKDRVVVETLHSTTCSDQLGLAPRSVETVIPDPRRAQVDRRRAKNRVARKSRRINQIRGVR
ncbi:hypothetical protein GYA93_17865 [Gordonia desulfuricans]|uniref:Uncharacterized protein n=1 Tax=Gordonia desulfuricans TaxID=89051 RepID=A0A7K3LT69_9ACTN|nr:hypothetical protein [Gordonia desulfuricans]NDK91430.1 hypothetical protein [Gordonia desulfuricans]